MIDKIRQTPFAKATSRVIRWSLKERIFAFVFLLSIFVAFYWGFIASDRYVSEAHVIVQRTDLASGQTMDFGAWLPGLSGTSSSEQLLLRDHLLSVDMLNKLDAELDLRAHYQKGFWRDPFTHILTTSISIEKFHTYYLSRVSVQYDEYAGVLIIRAQAFDAETAHSIAALLVKEGERYINELAHRLAEEQVLFLQKEINSLNRRSMDARQALIAYQNKYGLASPEAMAESLTAVVNKLEAQLTELQARRTALLGYLSPKAPGIVEIDLQIDAIRKQITTEMSRLAGSEGSSLNQTIEEYQRLQMDAKFAQDIYQTALVALEKGRVEAARTLKKVSVLQKPTMPEYPLEPRRLHNMLVFAVLAFLLAGVAHLIIIIIRDHKD